MGEIKIFAGKHKYGKEMDMRIVDVKNGNQKIVSWIIYGVCKKCDIVLIHDLFVQNEKPILDRDFIIDYDKTVRGV